MDLKVLYAIFMRVLGHFWLERRMDIAYRVLNESVVPAKAGIQVRYGTETWEDIGSRPSPG
jgi:hypothetical protein